MLLMGLCRVEAVNINDNGEPIETPDFDAAHCPRIRCASQVESWTRPRFFFI